MSVLTPVVTLSLGDLFVLGLAFGFLLSHFVLTVRAEHRRPHEFRRVMAEIEALVDDLTQRSRGRALPQGDADPTESAWYACAGGHAVRPMFTRGAPPDGPCPICDSAVWRRLSRAEEEQAREER